MSVIELPITWADLAPLYDAQQLQEKQKSLTHEHTLSGGTFASSWLDIADEVDKEIFTNCTGAGQVSLLHTFLVMKFVNERCAGLTRRQRFMQPVWHPAKMQTSLTT